MFIVHHLNNSRSQRILWLLEELELNYDLRRYERDAVTNLAPSELASVHPLGKAPVLEHNGRRIAESGAIVTYLCHRHGRHLVPRVQSDAYTTHLELMHFVEGSAMLPVVLSLYLGRLGEAGAPLRPRVQQQLDSHFAYMERMLRPSGHFVLDDLSAVDIMMSFPAEIAIKQGRGDVLPKLKQFVEKIHARPAWQRAMERGGAYRFA